MSSVTYRKYGPLVLTIVVALTIIVEYYLSAKIEPGTTVKYIADQWRTFSNVINLFATFVAILVLSRTNLYKAQHSPKTFDKFIAYEMLTLLGVSTVIGLIVGYRSDTYQTLVAYTLTGASIASIGTYYLWTFYAGYRTLRLRTLESTLLMIGAVVVTGGSSGWGIMWVPGLRESATWLQMTILQPVSKAIVIGGGIGAASAAVRALAGMESAYLKGE